MKVIKMEGAPLEQVADALNNRGGTYGQLEEIEKAIQDYTRVIEMKSVPLEQLTKALNNRGCVYSSASQYVLAEKDFQEGLKINENNAIIYQSYGELRARQGRWDESLEYVQQYASRLNSEESFILTEWLEVFYEGGLSQSESIRIAKDLVSICSEKGYSKELANSIPRTLRTVVEGKLDKSLLGRWKQTWIAATEEQEDFIIPMRLFTTGINYLESQPLDEGILLSLKSEERAFLQEILKLPSL